jgi:hypothetical protein
MHTGVEIEESPDTMQVQLIKSLGFEIVDYAIDYIGFKTNVT